MFTSAFQSIKKVKPHSTTPIQQELTSQTTGYSGVAIYIRSSVCAPIRAEEGITGILRPPQSDLSFFELPDEKQIGGYPNISQYRNTVIDAETLDSEGRAVILEFPAFVLIGTYCPANTDEARDDFRIGFLNLLDARIRNLVAMGKRVVLAGDINIIRGEMDTAGLKDRLRKEGVGAEGFFSSPARRLFNHMLAGGVVYGERDHGREKSVLEDICRKFHPDRQGMFTCWDTKKNLRPANFGSRIDYICASPEMRQWFSDSNIQEGLMGSDHCPVYATIKDKAMFEGRETDIKDIMNPAGMFKDGKRVRDWTLKDMLPISARLIPEFDRRQSIKDMFMRPALPKGQSTATSIVTGADAKTKTAESASQPSSSPVISGEKGNSVSASQARSPSRPPALSKRPAESASLSRPTKKNRAATAKATKNGPPKGQTSLAGFFKPKVTSSASGSHASLPNGGGDIKGSESWCSNLHLSANADGASDEPTATSMPPLPPSALEISKPFDLADQVDVVDPIVAKESWGKLLGGRVVPKCEHGEPCLSLTTKRPGANQGRSFYICLRPIGPSGDKEIDTEWRCRTFIWSSDWRGEGNG